MKKTFFFFFVVRQCSLDTKTGFQKMNTNGKGEEEASGLTGCY